MSSTSRKTGRARREELEEKNEKLTEHIERLVLHLKHETAAKNKALEEKKRLDRDLEASKMKVRALNKKLHSKDRANKELTEGCKILEDQLRLMDQREIEIREKLDYERGRVKRSEKKHADELLQMRQEMLLMKQRRPSTFSGTVRTKQNKYSEVIQSPVRMVTAQMKRHKRGTTNRPLSSLTKTSQIEPLEPLEPQQTQQAPVSPVATEPKDRLVSTTARDGENMPWSQENLNELKQDWKTQRSTKRLGPIQ
eukprot:TRINITY_DN3760_c0_g1_i1.p1 TRINITY_DN3760_c0_g1~~TRINITY_DN3760_c0_g1_i1.p1  ORF type:complete len:253 (-),score=55.12 TRINITY_DN3760_c0_g1_i1:151-909(-)